MLANDVSLRNLIPAELGKGFCFLQSKPATAFSLKGKNGQSLFGAIDQAIAPLPHFYWSNRPLALTQKARAAL